MKETRKHAHKLANVITAIIGALDMADVACDQRDWVTAARMVDIAIQECNACTAACGAICTQLESQIAMIRENCEEGD